MYFENFFPVKVKSSDMAYFVIGPVRKILKFASALKQEFWFYLSSSNEYFGTDSNFF